MSNITQFFPGGAAGGGGGKTNRRIFLSSDIGQPSASSASYTWEVPPDVTEVEVHCWGGGCPGQPNGGGAGGGYVTHVYPVTSSDVFSITVGTSSGTSSVSVPTQSPSSPISATGGSSRTTEGTGSYTIAPGISTARTFTARGGEGGSGGTPGGGGGAAGFIYGPGGGGGDFNPGGGGSGGGGGGIISHGVPGPITSAGHGGGGGGFNIAYDRRQVVNANPILGAAGKDGSIRLLGQGFEAEDWFYLHEIKGCGGSNYSVTTPIPSLVNCPGGSGGGGAGAPSAPGGRAGNGGIFGGGGGGSPAGNGAGEGGFGGGGGSFDPGPAGSFGRGGSGIVIFYW